MAKNKEIKFTQVELDSLTGLRNSYAQLELSLGRVEIARMQSEQRMEDLSNEKLRLETEYNETQEDEKTLVKTLNDKYGAGALNPETGVFIPEEVSKTEE